MADVDDVKKRMNEMAELLRAREKGQTEARENAARRAEERRKEEEARTKRVGDILEKAIRPKVEAMGAALALKEMVFHPQVLTMTVPRGLSPEEAAEVMSMRCVRVTFRHPMNEGARSAVVFAHRPDDAVLVYANGQKAGSVHVGPLGDEASFTRLAGELEGLFGDALLKLVDSSAP